MPPHPALADRAREEAFFRSPRVPADTIHSTYIIPTGDNNFLLTCATPNHRFALLLVVANSQSLTWRECQALNDCLLIVSRGTALTKPNFLHLVDQLRTKYGQAVRATADGVETAVVYPGTAQDAAERTEPWIIQRVAVALDSEGDVVVKATTCSGLLYIICLQLTGERGRLQNLDCKALRDIIALLERGEHVTVRDFWKGGRRMRDRYGFVSPKVAASGRSLSLSILASRVKNNSEMEQVFQGLGDDDQMGGDGGGWGGGGGTVSAANGHCPYQGIVYDGKLKESGQAQLWVGRRAGHRVAVKVFKGEEEGEATGVYKLELRVLLKMGRHPNVVEVLDFFETPEPALVMSFVEGEDLMDYLTRCGRMDERQGREMLKGIAKGLVHLHRNGVVHRDLKSLNIMRRRDGVPVIIDLGMGGVLERRGKGGRVGAAGMTMQQVCETLAGGMVGSAGAKTTALKGTVLWMAPEMIRDQRWSDKTDVYAFGIIMWEIFSGDIPFRRPDGEERTLMQLLMAVASGERPDMRAVSHIGSDMKRLMEACWDENPENRPSMRLVLDCLTGNDPREIFAAIDVNGSGSLDFWEFVTFLKRYAPGSVPPNEMWELFNAIDDNKSGDISLEEFKAFWRQVEMAGLKSAVQSVQYTSAQIAQYLEDS
eukprot:GFKZ01000643.1.p1 GENE.GFKZ01000643.1~~GFKZ01000643.1.p1  ORF type:complete len:684 (-),score=97.51 GFKZ01000643.1:1144-3105(-)